MHRHSTAQRSCQCFRRFCLPSSTIMPPQKRHQPRETFHDSGFGGLRWDDFCLPGLRRLIAVFRRRPEKMSSFVQVVEKTLVREFPDRVWSTLHVNDPFPIGNCRYACNALAICHDYLRSYLSEADFRCSNFHFGLTSSQWLSGFLFRLLIVLSLCRIALITGRRARSLPYAVLFISFHPG